MTPVQYGNLTQLLMMPEETEAIVAAIKAMPSDGVMVEWGSGGSTCKWLDTMSNQQRLITVEHNIEWFSTVKDSIEKHFGNISNKFQFHHVPEEPGYVHGYGQIEEENPFGLAKYICPTKDIYDGDLYFVDGIARGACVAAILVNRRKQNSRIFVHDFVPRYNAYNWISQFCTLTQYGATLVELKF